MSIPDLIVAGAPFQDEITLGSVEHQTAGGQAVYAALGASIVGGSTALVGRWPRNQLLEFRETFAGKVDVSACELISGEAGLVKMEYGENFEMKNVDVSSGLEMQVNFRDVPPMWREVRGLLVPGLGYLTNQLVFVSEAIRDSSHAFIAVSLSPCAVRESVKKCIKLIQTVDLVFLSLEEAMVLADGQGVFEFMDQNCRWSIVTSSTGRIFFVSAGRVVVFHSGEIDIVDPTGCGDALSGAISASLALGRPIETSIRYGIEAAQLAGSEVGPGALLKSGGRITMDVDGPSAGIGPDAERVFADTERISKISAVLADGNFQPFEFVEPAGFYPEVNHPKAAEYFFAVVLHQYGFWHLKDGKWNGSMFGTLDGQKYKGSDFIWKSATRDLLLDKEDITEFLDDDDNSPLPMLGTHRELSKAYYAYIKDHPPLVALEQANASDDPVASLLEYLKDVPGYKEDPMQKKAMLLAMTLSQRPEKFLQLKKGSDKTFGPVVDYHVQRTSLRTGIVIPSDMELRKKLIMRLELTQSEEEEIRQVTFDAMNLLAERSGVSHPALDLLFFQARRLCPEQEEPKCDECPLDAVCGKQKDLFQPVKRTTFY
ncbi:MAG: carbohydrate kinase family protein [Candidatus Lindowbacteria bacterium]|nr:carbohydrate kinase family protein [Candidatus Lindowbacteria bacterium]